MKKLHLNLFFVLLILLLLISLTLPEDFYRVVRVIDGDTIELENGRMVRLIGIDTPETVHPSKSVEYYGKEAGEFTRKMVEGKRIKLELDIQKQDKYNRLLAYVYLEDGTFLNAELVKQGYAKVSTYPPNVKYVDLFTKLQVEARENSRGLWKEEVQAYPISEGEIVYVTKTGSKYHRGNCRYLSKSKIPIQLNEAVLNYTPCSVCNPPVLEEKKTVQPQPQKKEITVYVTKTGSKYHRAGCRYLRKSMIPMSLSAAKLRYSPCSVCNPPR